MTHINLSLRTTYFYLFLLINCCPSIARKNCCPNGAWYYAASHVHIQRDSSVPLAGAHFHFRDPGRF